MPLEKESICFYENYLEANATVEVTGFTDTACQLKFLMKLKS